MKKIIRHIFLISVFSFSINAQPTFDFAFNHLNQDSNATLLKFKLIDFNFNDSEELVSIYKSDTSWTFNVDTKNHSRIFSYTNTDTSSILKNTLLFRKNDSWFLATISTVPNNVYDYSDELDFEIINLFSKQKIDSIRFNPLNHSGDYNNYSSLKIYNYKLNDKDYFYIGMLGEYSGHGPGVDYSGTASYISQINYTESLSLEKTYNGFNQLVKNGNIILGKSSSRDDYLNGSEFNINSYHIDSLSGEILLSNNFGYSSDFRHRVLSSDDITNNEYGISLLRDTYPTDTFFAFEPGTSNILWENNKSNLLLYSKILFCTNISGNDNSNYLIYFDNYNNYEVRSRITGEAIYNDGIAFLPLGIIGDRELNKYVYSFWSRTYTFYKINTDKLVSVRSEYIPHNYHLSQNYPNPFNPSTVIKYSLPSSSKVVLKVYDVLGKEIATVVNKEQSAGSYEVEFRTDGLSSGLYFYRLRARSFVETKKMILLR